MAYRVLSYGDLHLLSKDYGAHKNYQADSMYSLESVLEIARKYKVTHIIGLGDLSYGRITRLEYRRQVEDIFKELMDITNGNHYSLKGNHDSASYGMTEYEFYVSKGLILPSKNITLGNVNITMIDYGKIGKTEMNIKNIGSDKNIVYVHDYVRFKDTMMPNFGKAIYIDENKDLYGSDYIIAGHIHSPYTFTGKIVSDVSGELLAYETCVEYLGSLSRPSYREGMVLESGFLNIIDIDGYNDFQYNRIEINLPSIEETFNLGDIEVKKVLAADKEQLEVDISDIVANLNTHNRNIGEPEDMVRALEDIPVAYKEKAIELLKEANN